MADTKATAAQAETETPAVEALSFEASRLDDGSFVITTNELGVAMLRAALFTQGLHYHGEAQKHQQQIDNPSFMNPQPELHTAHRDAQLAARAESFGAVRKLEALIEGEDRWLVTIDELEATGAQAPAEPESTVEGPGEHNRHNTARRGLASTGQG